MSCDQKTILELKKVVHFNHAKIAAGLCCFHICWRMNYLNYRQTKIQPNLYYNRPPVAVTERDNMKTTGLCFTWCASLKTVGNVSCPNIIFQVCFAAIATSFLDKLPQFTSPFYSQRFPKNSRKMLGIRFLLMN